MGGLLGVGGGFLLVPLQVMLAGTPQLRASATSLAAIIPISIVGVLVYHFGGRSGSEVDLHFALLLMAGGVVGAFAGARAAARLPEVWLGRLVAVILGGLGLKQLLAP